MTIYTIVAYNRLRSFLLVSLFIIFFTSVFYFIGKTLGNSELYLILGLIISIFSTFISYFYSDKLILFSTKAKLASKKEYFDYYTVAENISIAAGLPMPKLYVINDSSMNAFTTGRNPKKSIICVTTGLLERLDRLEIEGVIAHELSHVKNYDMLLSSIVAVLVGALIIVIDLLSRSWFFSGTLLDRDDRNTNAIKFLFLIIIFLITPILATIIQLAISRKREFLADADGVLITRYPNGLANALEKISKDTVLFKNPSGATAHLFISNPFRNKNLKYRFSSLFSTHPPISERIKILRSL